MTGRGDGIDVTVVIPARNGAATIGEQLDALAVQRTSCTWELVVADNGSTDGTYACVAAHPITEVIPTRIVDASRETGTNVARNAGIAAARGSLVVLCDSDDVVAAGWLQGYWTALGGGPPTVAAGPLDMSWLNAPRLQAWGQPLVAPEQVSGAERGMGANMAFHRSVWEALGGFDEAYKYGFDEIEFFVRAAGQGVPFVWVGDSIVAYRLATSARVLLRKVFRHGRAGVHFSRQHQPPTEAPTLAGALDTTVKIAARLALSLLTRRPQAKQQARGLVYSTGMTVELVATRFRASRWSAPRRTPPAADGR
ncbi:MAG: glycosyltransferase family 2 protein [Ilumatobacteraceae bacterium]|nr:glycosyltransferase family 2 protein [Ilumatobacteraceae bacterium]